MTVKIRSRELNKRVDEPERKGAPCSRETDNGANKMADWEKQGGEIDTFIWKFKWKFHN